ncbi:Uncharacterized protein TCM_024271 [Theobroma cacao]|uniref:Putative plant transposon protein domain-containing protein n=1 Tax=Theobroma cacao TaxID=3641 RepID=A0A061F366_THECC|nr:Uncharacterized protein TCM_024271 [Theobroma cacao]
MGCLLCGHSDNHHGTKVPFNAHTINQFYNTLDIENDEYDQFVNGDINLDEVLRSLSILGTEWQVHKGVVISFKANAMDNDYKVWYHFVAMKLLLVKYLSDVTKDRAILLYAIVTKKFIDIGQLIFKNIIMSARSPPNGLWYPSLITALCCQARVVWSPNEELPHPKIPYGGGIIHRFHMCEKTAIGEVHWLHLNHSDIPRISPCLNEWIGLSAAWTTKLGVSKPLKT